MNSTTFLVTVEHQHGQPVTPKEIGVLLAGALTAHGVNDAGISVTQVIPHGSDWDSNRPAEVVMKYTAKPGGIHNTHTTNPHWSNR